MATAVLRTPARHRPRAAVVAVGAVTAAAWLALWVWGASPYGDYLHHDGLAHSGLPAPTLLVAFVGGWVLMLTAMMLPTVQPLLSTVTTLVRSRTDRVTLLAAVVAGYFAVWIAIGCVAFSADLALHQLDDQTGWVTPNHWLISAVVLALAGLYQFSSLKENCLTRCRTPRAVVFAHWHGRRPRLEAASIGLDHGWSCVGCCWALMLLMFAMGFESLGWMLGLAAVMTVEKVAPWGRRLTVPMAIALLLASALVVAANL